MTGLGLKMATGTRRGQNMEDYIKALNKIIPKELEVFRRRYSILKGIHLFQPIGRRALSDKIDLSEKMVRTETEFLKKENCIKSSGVGMELLDKGNQLLEDLGPFVKMMDGLVTVEEKVKQILGCKEVFIVPGNADEDEEAGHNIGHKAADVLLQKIEPNDVIALTGGSTVQGVIEELSSTDIHIKNVTVVPARGSLGRNVAYQANTLVAMLGDKINCPYYLLNIPDNLSQKALESVREEPEIQAALEQLLKANILVYGIGNAFKMAKRRNLSKVVVDELRRKNATAEALGYYFDNEGHIIYTSRSIGISVEQMTELKYPIAVAGGYSKSDAILSVRDILSKGCVIMDEGAARGILEKDKNNG